MSWRETEFESLYSIPSKNGLSRPTRVRGSGYKMINMGELFANDRIGDIDMELVPMNERELSTMLVQRGDLLFARQSLVLAGAGKCSIVSDADDPTTFEGHIIRVRLNQEVADPSFYHYYFKSPICRIRSIVTQGVQAGIRANDLKRLRVHIPDLETQTRIASILSAYDDLIENNRRRIQLLEQAARLLYKEWFVHLRFPGHEHVTITDGVPEGWEKTAINEYATVVRGKSYRSSEIVESGGKPFVNLKCVARHGGFRLDGLKRFSGPHRDDQVVVAGDIVIAVTDMTRDRHIVAHAARVPAAMSEEGVFSMDTVKIIPNAAVDISWFYYLLRFSEFSRVVREHATGTNVLHLKPKQIENYAAVFPTRMLQESFGEATQDILGQQDNLVIQNDRLGQARDLLLPRLMNGELVV